MTIQSHATAVAETLNQAGALASDLELPAGVPDRFRVAWALLRLTFDHAGAITSLFHHHGLELAGSGFALVRPMNEAFKRGTWFGLCATDEQTQTFIQEDKVPGGDRLAADIEAIPPFDQVRIFSGLHNNASNLLHSFTHGGSQMVGAYTMGDDGIGAAFPEEDILNVLDHAEAIGVQSVHVMSMICSQFNRELAESVQVQLTGIKTALDRKPTPQCSA